MEDSMRVFAEATDAALAAGDFAGAEAAMKRAIDLQVNTEFCLCDTICDTQILPETREKFRVHGESRDGSHGAVRGSRRNQKKECP